jgi:hypothetical protein
VLRLAAVVNPLFCVAAYQVAPFALRVFLERGPVPKQAAALVHTPSSSAASASRILPSNCHSTACIGASRVGPLDVCFRACEGANGATAWGR